MNQSSKITPLNPTPVEEESFIIKILQNKKLLINILLSLILFGLILGFTFGRIRKNESKSTSLAFSSLDQGDHLGSGADLKKLIKIANKYSFLRPHLDAPLIQESINQGKVTSARILNERLKKRAGDKLGVLFSFNEASFLITEKKYKEALEKSYEVLNQIDKSNLQVLYSYNLLRIASLEKQIGNSELYHQKLSDFLAFKDANPELKASLNLGAISLPDFLLNQID